MYSDGDLGALAKAEEDVTIVAVTTTGLGSAHTLRRVRGKAEVRQRVTGKARAYSRREVREVRRASREKERGKAPETRSPGTDAIFVADRTGRTNAPTPTLSRRVKVRVCTP